MAVDSIILAPESFRTIYLRREDRVIMRTERGQKIIIKRIVPDDWVAYRVFEHETLINENKKEIFLFDNTYTNQLTSQFKASVSNQ
jgi:hypothetical protein|tara:strand:+ start:14958 stop:15215 length:258 start_codon:yes stop_codon:yes gene_type:complete